MTSAAFSPDGKSPPATIAPETTAYSCSSVRPGTSEARDERGFFGRRSLQPFRPNCDISVAMSKYWRVLATLPFLTS